MFSQSLFFTKSSLNLEKVYYSTRSWSPQELNDFRPVALTSLVLKCLEKVVKDEIVQQSKYLIHCSLHLDRAGESRMLILHC